MMEKRSQTDDKSEQSAPSLPINPLVHFHGEAGKLREFVVQLGMKFEDHEATDSNDSQSIQYVASFLRGPALSWYQEYVDNNGQLFFRA